MREMVRLCECSVARFSRCSVTATGDLRHGSGTCSCNTGRECGRHGQRGCRSHSSAVHQLKLVEGHLPNRMYSDVVSVV